MEELFKLVGGGAVGLVVLGYVVKKYAWPWIQRKALDRYATMILQLLDELTDQLRDKYPESDAWKTADEYIDKIIESAGIEDKSNKRIK